MFRKNMGLCDRLIRLAIAVLLLVYAVWQHSWIAFVFSLFTFFEAAVSWCVVFQFLGINRCPISRIK